jgi:flagellar protein FlgJ
MSSTQELNQICNIAGYPMYSWAIAQLQKRSEILSNPNRTEDQINYLGNKGAWIRVVSSVNLEDSFIRYFKDQYGIDATGDSLAKKFMLFGGTSTYESGLRSGINTGGSYAILGDTEVKEYGYKPMPGITSVTIESAGRMGSVRQATVNFRVSDKMQLDVMDALYFRPGFTLLIEYGHTKYIDNKGNLQSTESLMIDPFIDTSKENIGIKISRNIQKSAGNYGGMLSVITSFNFSITQDGGYDCVLKTIAMGGVMGNYPINKLSILPNVYVESVKKYLDKRKAEAIEAAKKEQEAIKAAEAEKIKKSTTDNWTDLKIDDPVANLLYNIYPEYLQSKAATTNTPTTTGNPSTTGFQAFVPISTGFTYTIDGVNRAVKEWKTVNSNINLVKNQSSGFIAYNIINKDPNAKNALGLSQEGFGAVFIEKTNVSGAPGVSIGSELSGKYLAAPPPEAAAVDKQKGYVYAYINSNRITGILDDSLSSDKDSSDVQSPVLADFIREGQTITPPNFTNWFDAIETFLSSKITYWSKNQRTAAPNDRIRYTIKIDYTGDTATAKAIFLNPDTKWTVKNVFIRQTKPNLILENKTQGNTYQIFLGDVDSGVTNADLSFISNIVEADPNQDLAKNKAADQLDEIDKRAAQNIADIKNKYELEANAKTLKAIANSQSALELMLRSIMLYAIDNNGKTPMTPKFLKDLFSEGAYSAIFAKYGIPQQKSYTKADFTRYIQGSMNAAERLEINFRYGNSAYLMGAENVPDGANLLEIIPQIDFQSIFSIISVPYGETADIGIDDAPQKSVYISLGFFFMMLNHTGLLYNSNGQDALVPVTYVDFNPSTNYYLSSINQFSIDPFKYLLPYYGKKEDYKKLFRKDVLLNNDTIKLELSGSKVEPHSIFNFAKGVDQITPVLPNNKKDLNGILSNGYINRTMDTMVNINHLLKIIKTRSTADDFGEAYFQSILENIIASLNKSTGYYNAFRLSYSDSSNVFMIVDDHVQLKPDSLLNTAVGRIIENKSDSPEIPIQGKGSIARSFDIRTDISSRIASMIAISTNPGLGNQVGMGKNTSDFGVYNTGSHDRYMKVKTSDGSSNATNANATLSIQSNVQECQAAINFDTVVSSIYGLSNNTTEYLKPADVEQAAAYYKEAMAKVKNSQSGSVAAMIIPIKTSITMDGFSGIYPFQLFTINENMLPYRYNQANLKNSKVAFSTARLSHNFSNNEWTTSIEGFMTFLQKSDDQAPRKVEASDRIIVNISTNPPIITKSKTDFVKTYYPIAKIAGADKIDPIIILAQAAQESGWGNSNLAQNYNNFFGVTAGRSWTGRTYTVQRKPKPLIFRWYDSPQESFNGFVSLITNDSRYQKAEDVAKDYKAYAYQISISPYITEENGDDRNVYQNNIISNYEAILAIIKKEKIN